MPSDDILIRPTDETDIPALTEIYRHAVLHGTASYEVEPPGEAEMLRRCRDLTGRGFPHLVAERGGRVLGYAYAGPYRPRPAYRFSVEDSIYIAPDLHRAGVGSRLLAALIEACEAKGFRQIFASAGGGTENPASVRLHEKLGFRTIGIFEGSGFKHGRWLDTVLMQRPLGPGSSQPPEEAEPRN
ncbi:phosphinothricin acetyltransferase [Faunimonas pinastri]|uniref:Phosphinothricin acetyltransferase n=1 Tax=Faunimonas pinastri TaxID=1855383 RepID=A0A1H9MEV7_9HYPH|nr:GNAT family N-acetyltransferase [Faunimonas pinastri]SER22101.1 phosphinothricin acetyltransferase [Faunimonas pinastri]